MFMSYKYLRVLKNRIGYLFYFRLMFFKKIYLSLSLKHWNKHNIKNVTIFFVYFIHIREGFLFLMYTKILVIQISDHTYYIIKNFRTPDLFLNS